LAQGTVVERVAELLQPILVEMGLEITDLEYVREGRGSTLRVFIDKEGGVTLDDCAALSRELGTVLEVEDVIQAAYRLEVSSPGLDRPLKTPKDFQRFVGFLVKIKTYEKLDPDQRGHERKTFVGYLRGFDSGILSVEQNDKKGGVVALPLAAIAKANLEPEF
jgi:ribosome maturation factor RimP